MRAIILTSALLAIAVLVSIASHKLVSSLTPAIDSNCVMWVYCPDMQGTFSIGEFSHNYTITHEFAKQLNSNAGLMLKHAAAAIFLLTIVLFFAIVDSVNRAYIALQIAIRKHKLGVK